MVSHLGTDFWSYAVIQQLSFTLLLWQGRLRLSGQGPMVQVPHRNLVEISQLERAREKARKERHHHRCHKPCATNGTGREMVIHSLCFAYNLGGCDAAKDGERCPKVQSRNVCSRTHLGITPSFPRDGARKTGQTAC